MAIRFNPPIEIVGYYGSHRYVADKSKRRFRVEVRQGYTYDERYLPIWHGSDGAVYVMVNGDYYICVWDQTRRLYIAEVCRMLKYRRVHDGRD